MRRGDVRLALLDALLDGPAHGYELITRLEERSSGMWRPSAGSVYPTLQLLEEQGQISGRDEEGKRVFELTDSGRQEAEAVREARARSPFGEGGFGEAHRNLRATLGQLGMAARQVAQVGDDDQISAANAVLVEARQKLYRLLAGD